MRTVTVYPCANGVRCGASVDDSDRSVVVFSNYGEALGYVTFNDINKPQYGRDDGKTCRRCGTSMALIINRLGNPKGHPVVYCWCCGQAIRWAKEE